ncbi:hypothetical protein M4Y22_003761 [Serratia marcescens]|uniref:hypothetical protein n=1 Tax=Serratia TaxID=613 RepID=UPI000D3E16F7|nr:MULTISPECIES: hypothetical protein [Serratia]AWC81883.1 hypothetical protein AM377_20350 [Serratia marcescens]HDU7917423.1 hypothetical protein [Serratia marcescens]
MMAGKKNDGIFIIDRTVFLAACEISLNAAVSLLVIARGSGRDNATTSWSHNAIADYAGITRKRASDAMLLLIEHNLVEQVKSGSRPQYKIQISDVEDDYIFLPNSIVDGVGDEIAPVRRLRQMHDVQLLRLFIQLYSIHDLDNDGGMPIDMTKRVRDINVTRLYTNDIMSVFSCTDLGYEYNWPWYARSELLIDNVTSFDSFEEGMRELRSMGLIEAYGYVYEASLDDAEIIGPSYGKSVVEDLFEQLQRESNRHFDLKEKSHFAIVPKHIKSPDFRTVIRLRYRPHTTKTSRWRALESERGSYCMKLLQKAIDLETAKAIEREDDW